VRVAVVSTAAVPSPPPSYGGMEAINYYVAEALAERGHEVTLFAAKGSRTTKASLFETVDPQYEPDRSFSIEGAAWKLMESDLPKFDVIFDGTHAFWAYKHKLAHPEAHVVKVFHDFFPSATPPPRGSYDVLAGVSKFHARWLEERWGVPVISLYNGIPVDPLPYSSVKKDYLLFLSRLDPGKGAHTFLDVVHDLEDPPAVLAGDDSLEHGISDAYRRLILHQAVKLGVDYRGLVSDAEKKDLIMHAKAMVVPLADPYREVFGIWMVEALAAGTPVFTLDKGACQEIITRQVGGVADTAENLTEGLRRFLAGEFEFNPLFCRARATRFDFRETVLDYEAVGSSLMGESPTVPRGDTGRLAGEARAG
jgi:glycosyltransferase involved in cell wall biosynthesis